MRAPRYRITRHLVPTLEIIVELVRRASNDVKPVLRWRRKSKASRRGSEDEEKRSGLDWTHDLKGTSETCVSRMCDISLCLFYPDPWTGRPSTGCAGCAEKHVSVLCLGFVVDACLPAFYVLGRRRRRRIVRATASA